MGDMGASTFQLMAGFQEKDVKGTGRHCQGSGHFGALFQLQDLDTSAEFGFLVHLCHGFEFLYVK